MKLKKAILIVSVILFNIEGIYSSEKENSISIKISGIRSKEGNLLIGIYKDNKSFEKEKSFRNVKVTKQSFANGSVIAKIELEDGEYGLALLDDENGNGKMDYNFIGIPKEGFGFSNYYHTGLLRPHFDVFKFRHQKNQTKNIEIKVKYI